MGISTAVGNERISRIVGYQLTTGDFQELTPNLPQRIAILAEANIANQGTLDLTPKEITSAQEAGVLYGFGSPIYNIMRILRPVNGGGIGGIPTVVYPQAEAGGAVAAIQSITPVGSANKNATHTVVINGRRGVDGIRYDFSVVDGDNPAAIVAKIIDAVNAVLASPVIATDGTGKVNMTTKWKGLTSNDLDIFVDTNGVDVGVIYGIIFETGGSATPSISAALALFGSIWNTTLINSYGFPVLGDLEAFNGIPDKLNPTGRYVGIIMKPFIALFGDTSTDPSAITDSRKVEVTNAVCPAPNSPGWPMEAAANMAAISARIFQDAPNLDVNAKSYSDMPVPDDEVIGSMNDYNFRDSIVKKGSSTVDLVAGKYQIQDFVTTYHPDGEVPPQFRYVRNLNLDFNVKFGYALLEEINVVDHTIAKDGDIVDAVNVIKPKQWKQIIDKYAESLGLRALIADVPFMQDSIQVELSGVNPDRLETFFKYKRTGIARISSTTAEAGFNFGN